MKPRAYLETTIAGYLGARPSRDLDTAAHHQITWIRPAFWALVFALGLLHTWASRFTMNSDGVAYLEIGEAYARGDLGHAINPFWSPFYSWLIGLLLIVLRPGPETEYAALHALNFCLFLGASAAFESLLNRWVEFLRRVSASEEEKPLPEAALRATGYFLFLWFALHWITLELVAPDMAAALFAFAASGLLLRAHLERPSLSHCLLFGATLGLMYLSKTAMAALAVLYLIGLVPALRFPRDIPRLAGVVFGLSLVALPFVVAISIHKGSPTLGESGRLNYAWIVNGALFQPIDRSIRAALEGRVQRLSRDDSINPEFHVPRVRVFKTPRLATNPTGYDPTLWNAGVRPRLDLQDQLRALRLNTLFLLRYLSEAPPLYLLLAFFIGFSTRPRRFFRHVARMAFLFLPSLAMVGIYLAIHVEPRYVAPFVLLLWMGLFGGVRLPDAFSTSRLTRGHLAALLLLTLFYLVPSPLVAAARSFLHSEPPHRPLIRAIHAQGVQPGESVGVIGDLGFHSVWARTARVRLTAALSEADVRDFWIADEATKLKVYQAFREAGVKALVTRDLPADVRTPGWVKLDDTYGIYPLFSVRPPARSRRTGRQDFSPEGVS